MVNIKQKIVKFILSLVCLLSLYGCESIDNTKPTPLKEVDHHIVKIAIILPDSGTGAVREYSKMVKLGLADGTKTKIRLMSYDVTDEDSLSRSIEQVINSETDLIIGPILSEDTQKIVNKTGSNIPIITLSNNPVLADKQVFVFGHAPMRQMEYIVNYLLDKGYKNYITLLPSGNHSRNVSKVLNEMVQDKGGNIIQSEFYTDVPEDIEIKLRLVSDKVDEVNEIDDNQKQPVLLIADDSKALEKILNKAKKYNLDKKAVIAGDNRLDVAVSGGIDILFSGSHNIINSNLPTIAAKVGINHLSFMHILAYDAGKMVGSYIGNKYNKNYFLGKLNSDEKFDGMSGRISFTDSIASREYDAIKKEDGKYTILKEK